MAEAAEPVSLVSATPGPAVDTVLAAPSVPGIELAAESDAEDDQPTPALPRAASPRKPNVYTRRDLLHLESSPLVQPPVGMPTLREWYGDYYEPASTPTKKDTDAAAGRERTRFRHLDEAGDSNARPTFKASSFAQSTQMGNFKHQSLRDRDRDPSDRDRDGLRSLSDKYDRDRLSATATSPLSSTRQGRERDIAPHLAPGTSQRVPSNGQASTARKGDVKEGPKRKGEASDDWRRGAEPGRVGREDGDRLAAPRRRGEERERRDTSRQRDREDGRRDRDDRRGGGDRDRDDRDREDRRRTSGRDRESERDRDRDDDRHWRDDGRRDERISGRRGEDRGDRDDRDRESARSRERRGDRERDEPERETRRGNREDRDKERDDEFETKPTRRGGRGGESRRTAAPTEEEKTDKDRRDRDRQKEQPAWMETYVPDAAAGAGILGAAKEGSLDGLQAWKKEMKEKADKDKAAADGPAVPLAAAPLTKAPASGRGAHEDGLDEIAKFKLMMKRAQQTPPAPEAVPAVPAVADAVPAPAAGKHQPQENGVSGLRRIMGKDMKNDDSVLRSAGFAAPRKQSAARPNDFADASDFESGLSAANVSTSTPVIAQQATMDPVVAKAVEAPAQITSPPAPATSRLEALFRDSAVSSSSSSSAVPSSAKVQHDAAVASASYNSPQQPRLFSFAPHAAQAAMQNQNPANQSIAARTASGSSSHMPNTHAHAHPELTSRLNIDAAPPERGFSPYERSGPGAISPPLGGSSIDPRARVSPGHVDRPSLGSLDTMAQYPERASATAQSDQLSPQSAAGYGAGQSKGSRFAKFFHERPSATASAAQVQAAAGISHLHPQQPPQPPQPPQSFPQHAAMQRSHGLEPLSPGGLGGVAGGNNIQDLLSMLQNSSLHNPQLPAVGRQHVSPVPASSGSFAQQPLHLLNRGGDNGFNDHYAQEQLVQQLRSAPRNRERPQHVMNQPGMYEPDDVGPFVSSAQRLPQSQQALFEQLQGHAPVRQPPQQQMFAQGPQQRGIGMPPMGPPGAGFRPVPSPNQHLLQQQQQQQQRGVPAALASLGQRPPLDPNQFMGAGAGLGMGGMLPAAGNPGVLPPRAGGMMSPQHQAQQQYGAGGFGGPVGFPQQQQQQQQRNLLGGDFTVQPRGPPPPAHVLPPALRNATFGNPPQQFGQQQMGMRGGQQRMPHLGHVGPPPHMQLPLSPPGHQPMGSAGGQPDLMALLMGGRLE